MAERFGRPMGPWRLRAYRIIFEADTRAGRSFDLLLIATILAICKHCGKPLPEYRDD